MPSQAIRFVSWDATTRLTLRFCPTTRWLSVVPIGLSGIRITWVSWSEPSALVWLFSHGFAWLVLVGAAVGYFAYRIRNEEAFLVAEMGTNYADYMTRTKRLVPFV